MEESISISIFTVNDKPGKLTTVVNGYFTRGIKLISMISVISGDLFDFNLISSTGNQFVPPCIELNKTIFLLFYSSY
jgi:hypothetical protein